jgi:hypothetical protein
MYFMYNFIFLNMILIKKNKIIGQICEILCTNLLGYDYARRYKILKEILLFKMLSPSNLLNFSVS